MQLTKEQIDKYKVIYKEKFGEEISDSEAIEQGTALVNLIKVIYKPIKKTK